MSKPNPVLCIALLVLLGGGCKPKDPPASSSSSSSAPAAGGGSGQWTLQPGKETVVDDPSGAQVTVPAGAVGENQELTLKSAPPESQPGAVSRVYDLNIVGETHYRFKKPIRVSFPLDRSLVADDDEVFVSRWDSGRWQKIKGSHREGDRAVADIDHFSTHAATKGDKKKASKEQIPRHPLLNVGGWDVTIEITLGGQWSKQEVNHQESHSLSKSGTVRYRLSERHVDRDNKYANWSTPYKDWPPEDETRVTSTVNELFVDTDYDQDKTGNVFYYTSYDGNGSGRKHLINTLHVDPVKGTWTLNGGSVASGKTVMRYWDSWGKTLPPKSEDASVSWTSVTRPLPPDAGVLTATIELKKNDYSGWIHSSNAKPIHEASGTVTITLSPIGGVEARIEPPYEVRRGEEVTLDATGSLGDPVSYHWKVTVDKECPDTPEPMEHEGATWKFQALWSFKAELRIAAKSGKKSETTRRFYVKPRRGREWQLQFASKPKTDLDGPFKVGEMQFGVNQCDKHGQGIETGHKIHTEWKGRESGTMTWLDGGYVIGRVADDGPFKRMFFVGQATLEVDRAARVNRALTPGGAVYQLNTREGNLKMMALMREKLKENPQNQKAREALDRAAHHDTGAIDRLLEQVKFHEATHSSLMQTAYLLLPILENRDPGPLIEPLVSRDASKVKKDADDLIRPAETDLYNAAKHSKVKPLLDIPRFRGKVWIWVPGREKDEFDYVELGPLFELGDDYPPTEKD